MTVSHLRFGPRPIRSTYLVEDADFVAVPPVRAAGADAGPRPRKRGATFLLNSPYGPDDVWDRLPRPVQQGLIDKDIDLWVIDAYRVARGGDGQHINTVMQPCFFCFTGRAPRRRGHRPDQAVGGADLRPEGRTVVERTTAAIDRSLAALHRVDVPAQVTGDGSTMLAVPDTAPDFVQRVTARLIAGEGDLLQ